MDSILYLYLVKTKAKIRNILSKPSSAIITLLVIAFYGYSILRVITSNEPMMNAQAIKIYFLIALAFSLMITSLTLMNSRTALFFEEDSYFLFIGPFRNQQILSYLNFANSMQCLLLGLMSGFIPVMMFQAAGSIPIGFVLFTSFLTGLICYILLTILDIIYLKDIISETKTQKRRWLAGSFIICIVAVFAYQFLSSGMNISTAFMQFINSPEFNFVPLFGWANFALNALATQDYLIALAITVLLIALCLLVSFALANVKGYFYEQAMVDAVEFTEIYKKARAGKAAEATIKKVHEAKVNFLPGEKALLSKSLLILKKTRKFLALQEIVSLVVVIVVFGYVLDLNFLFYCGMVIFYMINSINSSPLIEELKHIYVYLIPGSPFKKILNTLAIPFLRTCFFGLLMIIGGYVAYQPDIFLAVFATVATLSFVFIMYGADVFAVRILKSRKSQMVVLMIRSLIMFISCIPGVIIGIIMFTQTQDINQVVAITALIISFFNIGLGILMTYLCRSMFSGNAYLED